MYFESEVIARFMMYDSTSESKEKREIRINFTNTKQVTSSYFPITNHQI